MTIDEFQKNELLVAKILSAERVEGSEKLLKLQVDAGDKDSAGAPVSRQIISGIAKAYSPEDIVGKEVVIIANLDPRQFKIKIKNGDSSVDSEPIILESHGMLLAATEEGGLPVLLVPERELAPGSHIS
jgi:tRNA-binding EMAP/Myf-like protein